MPPAKTMRQADPAYAQRFGQAADGIGAVGFYPLKACRARFVRGLQQGFGIGEFGQQSIDHRLCAGLFHLHGHFLQNYRLYTVAVYALRRAALRHRLRLCAGHHRGRFFSLLALCQ